MAYQTLLLSIEDHYLSQNFDHLFTTNLTLGVDSLLPSIRRLTDKSRHRTIL